MAKFNNAETAERHFGVLRKPCRHWLRMMGMKISCQKLAEFNYVGTDGRDSVLVWRAQGSGQDTQRLDPNSKLGY